MNVLDLIIIVLLVAAVARGVVQGAVMQLFPFGGFWIGLLIGSALAPVAAAFVAGRSSKALASLIVLFLVAIGLSGLGRQIGVKVWRAIHRTKLSLADAVGGAFIAGAATLFAVWLIAVLFSALPLSTVSGAIHGSAIVRGLDENLPPAPSVFARLRQLIGAGSFPDVFAGLEPSGFDPVDLPSDPEVRAAFEAAGAATVRIVGEGCGGTKTGSGFVARDGLVVTNAHVIGGIDRPIIEDRRGRHISTPVLFDPDLDIAILRTSGLFAGPLEMVTQEVPRGTQGAVLGYPGGGSITAEAGAVSDQFRATGRDIYGDGLTVREVYQLQSKVRPGNSGGPFVENDGEVMGVVFSASATNPSIGYAITSEEVIPEIEAGSSRTNAVDTGPCT